MQCFKKCNISDCEFSFTGHELNFAFLDKIQTIVGTTDRACFKNNDIIILIVLLEREKSG